MNASAMVRTRIGVSTYVAPPGALVEEQSIERLGECLEACVQAGEVQLVLDFSNVTLIASTALETLLDTHDQVTRLGGRIVIANANRPFPTKTEGELEPNKRPRRRIEGDKVGAKSAFMAIGRRVGGR